MFEEIEKTKKKHPEEVKQEETYSEAVKAGHMQPNFAGEMGGSQSVIIEDLTLSQPSLGKRSRFEFDIGEDIYSKVESITKYQRTHL